MAYAPNERPSASKLLLHPFLRKHVKSMKQIFEENLAIFDSRNRAHSNLKQSVLDACKPLNEPLKASNNTVKI